MAGRIAPFALLLLALPGPGAPVWAQQAAPAAAEEPVVLDYLADRNERMTVPVSIDGRGPYNFVVDTGAERTVIARELADDLALGAGPRARVHSMSEVSDIETVLIPRLEVAGKNVKRVEAPTLSRRNLGAEGMLGVDSLKSKRVMFDFVRQQMSITPARKREEKWAQGAIVVTGRRHFGQLVLVDASVDGQKVWVILDTGSEVTIANGALRRQLEAKGKMRPTKPIEVTSVTGGRINADQSVVQRIKVGGMDIKDMPIAFADVHPFRKLKLTDRAALLLGMDALRLFDRVSVDFSSRKVRMLARPQSRLEVETQLAGLRR
ncbi:MAG TPA: retroviral-like aspartic protease family protein [Allosphingosinicella sp.]|jgi:predicted aspartyl protease